jgi:hypothetical protein
MKTAGPPARLTGAAKCYIITLTGPERRAVFDPQRGGPMKQIKYAGRSFLLLAIVCLVFPFYSYAYIDPGTGSYVFQIIVAALVAVSFAVKVYWLKIKGFIAGLITKKGK